MQSSRVLEWASNNVINEQTILSLIKEDPLCKTALQIQNAMSAYVYLISWFLSDFYKLKDLREANLTKGKKRGAKKEKTEEQS